MSIPTKEQLDEILLRRYNQFGFEGRMVESEYGDWTWYHDVKEIAERLENLRVILSPDMHVIDNVTNELAAIINEIKGKQ